MIEDEEKCFPNFKGRRKNHLADWYKRTILLSHPMVLFKSSLILEELPRWLRGKKNPPANTGDAGGLGSIPGSGRSPGEENGNPPQFSCLESPMDRGP